ncbi:hypothetical protein M427DRAFT_308864 [Gonapodya prolifera JEL478]|uniref:Uncharacterized protein n=1 Tax=Gonapodya prolifera (strain JEL478) TaxID=1344416 RepID=A0A139AGJ2_GONPJ|nr:hypothetical protein M427DRAFT_308864 [Gonapodya prolifera JEL478]|eukprot:KXS15809.1 hypothetical protein M427DRAFT_308864 [Gonapodya prolifera JEL478]
MFIPIEKCRAHYRPQEKIFRFTMESVVFDLLLPFPVMRSVPHPTSPDPIKVKLSGSFSHSPFRSPNSAHGQDTSSPLKLQTRRYVRWHRFSCRESASECHRGKHGETSQKQTPCLQSMFLLPNSEKKVSNVARQPLRAQCQRYMRHLLSETPPDRCDSGQPRCSHCEIRGLVCDYSWEQKPRGPAGDPLSPRSARRVSVLFVENTNKMQEHGILTELSGGRWWLQSPNN